MLERFFKPRLTELGKIKIGGKGVERVSQKGKKYRQPLKLDSFIITTLQRDQQGNLEPDMELMTQLAEKYGTAANGSAKTGDPGVVDTGDGLKVLRQIPIRLLSNDPEDVMQSAYVWYGSKAVGARSDGKEVTWYHDPKTGKRLPEPKVEPWDSAMLDMEDSWRGAKLFKLHTIFNCVIAAQEAKWGGVYKFRTTSVITGGQLYGSLTHLCQLTGGVLVGMPLVMVVRPMQVTPNGTAITVYVVHVELHGPDLKAIQDQAADQMKYLVENKAMMQRAQKQYRALLVAPGEETSAAETIDIEGEFHPEQPSKDDLPAPAEPDPLLQTTPREPIADPEKELGLGAEPEAAPDEPGLTEVTNEFGRDAAMNIIEDFLQGASPEQKEKFDSECMKRGTTMATWNKSGDGVLSLLESWAADQMAKNQEG